jgi:hypothetical protein
VTGDRIGADPTVIGLITGGAERFVEDRKTVARPHPMLIDVAAGRMRAGTAFSADAYDSAREHGLQGLVDHAIARGDLVVPEELRLPSARSRVALRAATLDLWDDYERVVGALEAIDVEVAVFKGIATDSLYYPEFATRPAADLDLLLAPSALGRFGDALATLDPDHPLIGSIDELIHRDLLQSVDVRLDSGLWVDLHVDPVKTGIALRSRDAMWERIEHHEADEGRAFRTLCASDALVQAVIHQLKDRFSLLKGHADIARIIQSDAVDWNVVTRTLAADGLAGLFWPSLSIVLDELHLHSIVAPTPSIGTFSVNRVWPPDTRLRGETGMEKKVRAKHAIPFLMRGRFREAFTHYWRVLFPPKVVLAYQHPAFGGPYLWRLLRMRMSFARMRHRRNAEERKAMTD